MFSSFFEGLTVGDALVMFRDFFIFDVFGGVGRLLLRILQVVLVERGGNVGVAFQLVASAVATRTLTIRVVT